MALIKSIGGNEICDATCRSNVDGITISCRNLLPDTRSLENNVYSSFPVTYNYHNRNTNARGGYLDTSKGLQTFVQYNLNNYKLGETYTFSFRVSCDRNTKLRCFFYGASGYPGAQPIKCSGGVLTGMGDGNTTLNIAASNDQYVWVTWKISDTGDNSITKYVLIRSDATDNDTYLYIAEPKLELGNKPTQWTPALEDALTMKDDGNGNVTMTII